MKLPVVAIFDLGKTNKKLFLFNENYEVVYEELFSIPETVDEDGFPCEDLNALTSWMKHSLDRLVKANQYFVRALNFAAYGASFVYLDNQQKIFLPLYNYLKPFPLQLQQQFNDRFGEPDKMSLETASPLLGHLNSGMQLYRLKYERPEQFAKIKFALHLPQYCSFIFSGALRSDLTSIGCHTRLWDFNKKGYHQWVMDEGLTILLQPISPCDTIIGSNQSVAIGTGLHDSSSALIPYIELIEEPFLLLSTGTWCISLNPFNHTPLTREELQQDCLCYLSHRGTPVKASRLFSGNEHEQEVKKMADFFHQPTDYYKTIVYDEALATQMNFLQNQAVGKSPDRGSGFIKRDPQESDNFEQAYHQLMVDLVTAQVRSTMLVLNGSDVKKIFVEGGFASNTIYIRLLQKALPEMIIIPASFPHAAALGAALAIHETWNTSGNRPTLQNETTSR